MVVSVGECLTETRLYYFRGLRHRRRAQEFSLPTREPAINDGRQPHCCLVIDECRMEIACLNLRFSAQVHSAFAYPPKTEDVSN